MNLRQLVERSDRPFASLPQVGRYFPAASTEDARQRLARTIERGEGPGVVIGGAGIGKSLLLQVLGAQFRERFDVVLLACAQLCTRRALLQAIHFELGLDYRRRDEGELRLSLMDTLLSGDAATQGLLLLVDESQALANHLLEELRLLTNLSRGGVPRVRLVLAGLPSLEEKLTSPELQSFSQRLSARCYLTALSRTETSQYICAQLAASQADPGQIFATAALDAVFSATDGVPRLVNQLCDRALTLADTHRLEQIDAEVIQAAWADLQQLPSAWKPAKPLATTNQGSAASVASTASVIEFGSLEDRPVPGRVPVSAPIVSLHDDLTELDEEPLPTAPPIPATPKAVTTISPLTPQQPIVVRRPRVFSGRVPEAVDPFADRFEEEELVLDSFATLAGIFGTRAPRVENSREPAISRMVQNALQANAATETRDVDSATEELATDERQAPRPALRLAVVNDTPAVNEPIATSGPTESNQPVLVIEDDPSDSDGPQPGVRRESYRQLFTRLRHGT